MKTPSTNFREVESDIRTNFKGAMAYGDYLHLDKILSAQEMRTDEHDEMLFVVIHQASELWLKLAVHEVSAAIRLIDEGQFRRAFKVLARVKEILNQMKQSWSILATMTPVDYLKFRDSLGNASGFQSVGYRSLEFLLGNKNAQAIRVHKDRPSCTARLEALLAKPSLYDAAIAQLVRAGFAIDPELASRDPREPYQYNDSVEAAWTKVYRFSDRFYDLYELAETLVDLEDAFQNWRFRHMYTVQRIIGFRRGTGGSSGVGFLKKALDTSFYPELLALRTNI
ncbi:MAG: tryptophan 2,3-dioxygenase family protein [Pseudomonadota bacterium]